MMSIKDFAEKFIKAEDEAWHRGNLAALQALEAPDAVYNLTPPFQFVGWEAHKEQILGMRRAISNLHHEFRYLAGSGNLFLLAYRMNGRFTGEIPGLPPPTGDQVSADGLFAFRVKNGKVVEAWSRSIMTGLPS
jgi:predicted ester cyclase